MVRQLYQRGWVQYAKTISYCLMHFTVAIAVAYALSGSWVIALSIGTVEPLVQTCCYFMHEKAWTRAVEKVKDAGATPFAAV